MMVKNYYPRLKNLIGLCVVGLSLLGGSKAHAQLPVITHVSDTQGIPGNVDTITGTGFNAVTSKNIVRFGATTAAITSGTTTQLVVTIPLGATHAPITVTDTSSTIRKTGYQQFPFVPDYDNGCFIQGVFNFQNRIDIGVPSSPTPYIAQVGDLDGDGLTDLITANHTSTTGAPRLSIFRNTSTGIGNVSQTFVTSYTHGGVPVNLKLADFDGDGKLDAVSALGSSVNVAVYRNITSGTIAFANVSPFRISGATTPDQFGVIAADFDGDGKPDIAAVLKGADSIGVLRNTIATGTPTGVSAFSTTTSFATYRCFSTGSGSAPNSIFAADFDGDGKIDIVTSNSTNNTISVFRNTSSSGSISFATHTDFSYGSGYTCTDVSTADIDGDGKQDIFVSITNISNNDGYVSIFKNTSSGSGSISFATHTDVFVNGSDPTTGVSSADIDGDGKIDIVTTQTYVSSRLYILRNTRSSVGSISFSSPFRLNANTNPVAVTIGDMDNDKKPDIVTACASGNNISIFRNYPLPYVAVIGGPDTICTTSTTATMTDSVSGGTWTSTSHSALINPTSGLITPLAAGRDTITYTVVCQGDTNSRVKVINIVAPVTVFSISASRTAMCSGDTIMVSNLSPSGTWSSSNNTVATVAATTFPNAVVTGVAGGTAVISYTRSNFCGAVSTTQTFTINQTPSAITGITHQCVGSGSTTLSNAHTGGTWSRTFTYINIGSSSGVVTGLAAGVDTVRYTLPGGCFVTTPDTVLPAAPTIGAITGRTSICAGTLDTMYSTPAGGRWSSSNTSVATVDSVSGVIRGLTAGSAVISYSIANSCGSNYRTATLTVNANPTAITGATTICAGTPTTLTSTVGGGSWTSSASGTAAVGTVTSTGTGTGSSSSAIVTGGSTSGVATITYTLGGICSVTQSVTVNPAPSGISGATSICVNSTTTLSNSTTGGGTWASSNPSIASIGASSGIVTSGATSGTVTISFTSAAYGCTITRSLIVNPIPNVIVPTTTTTVCAGSSIGFTETGGTGTWSTSDPSIATTTGSGLSATLFGSTGVTSTSYADIIFTSTATGCSRYLTVTVEPIPAAIAGSHNVCAGATDTLSSAATGGVWSITPLTVATISATGVVYALTSGSATVRYTNTITNCYATFAVTVNPLPAAITGLASVCPGYTDTLSSATTTATWSSSDISLATISTAGVVTGIASGLDTIYYTFSSTGCRVSYPIVVKTAPMPIMGASTVCQGFTTLLTDSTSGGTWSSSVAGYASVDTTGLVTGSSAGSVIITYTTASNGCSAFFPFTVLPTLVPYAGISMSTGTTICAGTYVTYTANVVNGGSAPTYQWKINGVVTGTGPTLTYAPVNGDVVRLRVISNAPCAAPDSATSTVTMTVNPLLVPSVNITTGMGDTVCLASSITFSPNGLNGGASPTYSWKINGVPVWTGPTWTYFPANGDVISVRMTSTATCRTSDTASDVLNITVSPYVTPTVSIAGSDTVCEGYPVVYRAVQTGGGTAPTYQWYVNGTATSTGGTLAYIPTNGDYVWVTMTSSFPCVATSTATSATDTVRVIPVYVPSVTVTVAPGYIIPAGTMAYFTATVVNGGASPTYRWYKNGIPIAGATNLTYRTRSLATNDSLVLRATNNDFCNEITAFGYVIITIGDNVGVDEINNPNASVSLMPNPNNGSFTITGDLATGIDEDVDVEITNMMGQVIYRNKVKTTDGTIEQRISLDGPPANGLYMISLHSAHVSKVIRFVLEK